MQSMMIEKVDSSRPARKCLKSHRTAMPSLQSALSQASSHPRYSYAFPMCCYTATRFIRPFLANRVQSSTHTWPFRAAASCISRADWWWSLCGTLKSIELMNNLPENVLRHACSTEYCCCLPAETTLMTIVAMRLALSRFMKREITWRCSSWFWS